MFRVTVKQKAYLDSRRVPKARTHTARIPVSQRTTLPQMGEISVTLSKTKPEIDANLV